MQRVYAEGICRGCMQRVYAEGIYYSESEEGGLPACEQGMAKVITGHAVVNAHFRPPPSNEQSNCVLTRRIEIRSAGEYLWINGIPQ